MLQGAGPNTAAAATCPRTAGSAECPQEDKFWSDPDWCFLRDAFLKKAVEHLAPAESDDSGTDSDGPGVFPSAAHLGGTEGGLPEMAVPWSFNQFTPQLRVFGGGTWPGPGSGIWHGDSYTGKGATDLDLLALSFEGALYKRVVGFRHLDAIQTRLRQLVGPYPQPQILCGLLEGPQSCYRPPPVIGAFG